MRLAFLSLSSLIFAALVLADGPAPSTRPSTSSKESSESKKAEPATPVDRDAVIRALREKEEAEEDGFAGEPADPDAPARVSEPVVKPMSPERLKSGHTSRTNVNVQLIRWIDVDGDGKPELVVPPWNGPILVFKDLAAEPKEIKLEGLGRDTMLSDLVAIPQSKGVRWFVATRGAVYGGLFGASGPAASMAALYSEAGKRLWQYQMKIPKNYSVEMHVAAGDVDGDGAREYFVGVAVQKMQSSGRSSWNVSDQNAYLLVFNEQGKQIASRKAGDSLQSIQVVASPKPGEPGRVLLLSYDRIATYTLEPAKPPVTQPQAK